MLKNTKSIHASANMARAMAATNKKDDDDDDDKQQQNRMRKKEKIKTAPWVYFALVIFAVITYVAKPDPLQPPRGEAPSIQHVFYYGWLTAISTGLGAIPLVFAPNLASYWVGISNGTFLRFNFYQRSTVAYRYITLHYIDDVFLIC